MALLPPRWVNRLLLAFLFLLVAPQPAHPSPTACVGRGVIAQDVWTLAREIDKATQVTHVPKLYGQAIADSFFQVMQADALEDGIADCALGMATLIVHSLPEAEMQMGLATAREYYMLFESLVQNYGHLWNDGGFTWGLESQQSAGYPLLLGLKPQSCFGMNLKVFVYETDLAKRVLSCSQGMFASEVFVHRWLMHSECRTEDPAEADFFFVPVYAACVMTKEGKLAGDMDAFYTNLVTEGLPHFRDRGQDHVFLWSSETYDFPAWHKHIHSSIFLSVEAQPIECSDFDFFSEETAANFGASCWHCPWCFSYGKDAVIPGFVEKWSIKKMHDVEKAPSERKYTACYHGIDSDSLAIYKYANTTARNDLQLLRTLPNVSIGYRFNKIIDYFERIGDCHFCFAPKGLGYWSNRLYEVLFAGCIPVILSDEIGLPFDDFVDWTSFSLKWPMTEVTPALVQHLEDMLTHRLPLVERMHENVVKNRCWFDYNSEDVACSPYLGIVKALQKRKAGRLRTPGLWWRHRRDAVAAVHGGSR